MTQPPPTPGRPAAATGWPCTSTTPPARSPLLLQCVGPLVDELDADGLLAGYFFINYWLEGPHVRLRLRPATPAAERRGAAPRRGGGDAFLRSRPALYNVEHRLPLRVLQHAVRHRVRGHRARPTTSGPSRAG